MSFQFGDAAKLTPPFRLVATYFVTSLAFFLAGVFLTLINYTDFQEFYFQPHILAITHTLALGWITMIISGAMYQLIPVVFRVRVFSITLAYFQYYVLTVGAIGMIYGFYKFNISMGFVVFASLAYLGVVTFVLNVLMSMTKVKEWNITGVHFITAMIFLFIAVSVGLILALNLQFGFLMVNHLEILKVHAHIAIVGFVTLVIFGAVYQLVPMFSLSYDFPKLFGWIAYILIVSGLTAYGILITFWDNTKLADLSSLVMAAGIFAFLFQVAIILKKRVRRKLDAGLKQTVVSFGYLGLATAIVVISIVWNLWKDIPRSNVALAVSFFIFFGYIGSLILGQMLKIGPFLVWLRKYSDKVGISDVPSLHEMVDQRLAYLQLFLWSTAVPVATLAIVLSDMPILFAGCAAMMLSAIIFVFVQYKIFRR
jgi:hypothetical protein